MGGVDTVKQSIALGKRPHVVVAMPGRLLDHLTDKTKGFSLRKLKYLVLDEVDRFLNEDFQESLDKILSQIPRDRRTFLFSATMTNEIVASPKYSTVDTLKQQYCLAAPKHKDCYLVHILTELSGSTPMVFTRTCDATMLLAYFLRNLSFRVIPINGHMTQSKRLGALNIFKVGECNILVCSDVASRGLDMPSVDVVINCEIPLNPKDYIHRVGRTARAGLLELAITMVNQYDIQWYKQIEEHIGKMRPEYPTEKDEVLLLMERVREAKRIAQMKFKDARGKKRRRGDDDGEEDVSKYLNQNKGRSSKRANRRKR